MKKILIALIAMIGCMSFTHSQTTDFRGLRWGDSLDTVQATEKSRFLLKVNDDELVYKDILGGSDCDVYYIFNDNDKLASGMYRFSKLYSNPQLYLQDYTKFKKLLTKKYGKPVSDKENWHSSRPPVEIHNYGQAIADGNLTLNTVWTTPRSLIKIVLVNTNDKHPSLQIHYTTRSLDELENKEELKEAIKKL